MYLYYGNTKALMDTTCDMTFTGENENDRFGCDVAIGDINGDDFGEVLTGARTFKNNSFQGRAYLYYGGPSKPEAVRATNLLRQAARAGDINHVKSLISNGADVNEKDNKRYTSLWYTKNKGNNEIVELLRKHGAKE